MTISLRDRFLVSEAQGAKAFSIHSIPFPERHADKPQEKQI